MDKLKYIKHIVHFVLQSHMCIYAVQDIRRYSSTYTTTICPPPPSQPAHLILNTLADLQCQRPYTDTARADTEHAVI